MITDKIIEKTLQDYKALNFGEVINYEKMRLYSIVANSTALEGSTLTVVDTQLLLDDGITAKGKPMIHHLMVQDNYNALVATIEIAKEKSSLTQDVLQKINGINMKNTGEIVNSALGTVDGTKGEFRKVQAFSEALGYYFAPQKIPAAVEAFCKETQMQMNSPLSKSDALKLSFEKMATLIIIHPWQDGNKRTSRLLANYIQQYFDLPLGNVLLEDQAEYLQNLKVYKDSGDIAPFVEFMTERYIDRLNKEILMNKQNHQMELPKMNGGVKFRTKSKPSMRKRGMRM